MDSAGLTQIEAEKKLKKFGLNQIARKKRVSDLELLIAQVKSPLIYVLLVAMAITGGFLHDVEDTIVIGLAVVLNTFLGFVQERKANRSLEALAAVLSPQAKVKRDGEWKDIEAKLVVPGDLVRLELGTRIAADGKVVNADSLSVDEAILTGESASVTKNKKDKVFMGTTIAGGIGEMVVTRTGEKTEFGKIAASLQTTVNQATPLQAQIGRLAKVMALIVFLISLLVMGLGLYVGDSFREIFPTAVALAVAAIPEGLAVSLTVILAIGMQRILKKKALVRKLVAAETLGGVTVICADKTGTLTEGKMRVVKVLGGAEKELLLKATVLVNDLRDPLEISMMDWARPQLGRFGGQDKLVKQYTRLDEIPFDPKWRYIATLHNWEKGKKMMLVSGAPEEVLSRCTLSEASKKKWQEQFAEQGNKGHRLVGFAYRKVDSSKRRLHDTDIDKLVWLGSLVYEDPIREGVREALEKMERAGIKVKVITGDYAPTAEAIMRQLKLMKPKEVGATMEGAQLQKLSDEELKRKIGKIKLFARTSPEQKLKLVEILQDLGEVVAMTGDGVNDAPALKKADIGVVVETASDVSKETADMVLLDNNFKTILAAIEGGREIYSNLRKVILYLLADSFAEIVIVMLALITRIPLPVTAAMILWVNLMSDGFPDLALTVDPPDKDLLSRPPRKRRKHLIDGEMGLIIFLISLTSGVIAFGAFWHYWHLPGYGLDAARTVAFSLLGLNSLFYVWSAKSLDKPLWHEDLERNWWLVGAVLLGFGLHLFGIYTPIGQRLLGTVPLNLNEWVIILLGSLMMIVIVEGVKLVYNRPSRAKGKN